MVEHHWGDDECPNRLPAGGAARDVLKPSRRITDSHAGRRVRSFPGPLALRIENVPCFSRVGAGAPIGSICAASVTSDSPIGFPVFAIVIINCPSSLAKSARIGLDFGGHGYSPQDSESRISFSHPWTGHIGSIQICMRGPSLSGMMCVGAHSHVQVSCVIVP